MFDNPTFIAMTSTIATKGGSLRAGMLYALDASTADELIRKRHAYASNDRPQYVLDLLGRLDDGAGKPCIFAPPIGAEFGHILLSHVRMVHFHRASEKIVCCRPGTEALYPSATKCITDWTDPTPDRMRMGSSREHQPEESPQWAEIRAQYPDHHVVSYAGLSLEQEMWCIEPLKQIKFNPKRRGLRADVLFGVRHRELATERNWQHWHALADAANAAGITFAVVAARETSFDLAGQVLHTEGDTDAAIELMQNCQLYIGNDSGASHLAATVGAPMLIVGRNESSGFRDFVHRMEQVNPHPVEVIKGTWNNPQPIIDRMLKVKPSANHFRAQHGEDKWLAKHWSSLGLPDHGTFVEVGAGDGIHLSNTAWLARAKGWKGLLIEPDPRSYEQLKANRPESIVIDHAAGAEPDVLSFGLAAEPTHSGILHPSNNRLDVQVETLSQMLEKHKIDRVHVLSIDTEGSELDVWEGLDLSRWRPALVIIEWNTVGFPDRSAEIIQRIERDGYLLVAQLGGNLIFRARELINS